MRFTTIILVVVIGFGEFMLPKAFSAPEADGWNTEFAKACHRDGYYPMYNEDAKQMVCSGRTATHYHPDAHQPDYGTLGKIADFLKPLGHGRIPLGEVWGGTLTAEQKNQTFGSGIVGGPSQKVSEFRVKLGFTLGGDPSRNAGVPAAVPAAPAQAPAAALAEDPAAAAQHDIDRFCKANLDKC